MSDFKSEKIRKQYRFSGRVQGVGFRYTAQHAARALGITGWVYNEYDGSVIMEAQGTASSLEKLIEMLNDGIFIEIDNIEVQQIPVVKSEIEFYIKD